MVISVEEQKILIHKYYAQYKEGDCVKHMIGLIDEKASECTDKIIGGLKVQN